MYAAGVLIPRRVRPIPGRWNASARPLHAGRGVSAEATERLHLPYPLLSDERLELASALGLPTFEVEGITLLKRLTLVVRDGVIESVIYPVFPPNRSAEQALAQLAG